MQDYKNSKLGRQTARKYADILYEERPHSPESLRRHPRMPLQNRAKIFSPFAALRGYDDVLDEEVQQSDRVPRRCLTEEEAAVLSARLQQVKKGSILTVRYFAEDTAHPAQPPLGVYRTLRGRVEAIDPVYHILRLGTERIRFEDLAELHGEGIAETADE